MRSFSEGVSFDERRMIQFSPGRDGDKTVSTDTRAASQMDDHPEFRRYPARA